MALPTAGHKGDSDPVREYRPDAPVVVSRWPFRRIAYVLGVTAFGAGIPTPLYALYEQRYHFTAGVLAAVFAAYTAGVLATMLFVAPLSDAIGRKPVLYLGMGLTAASGFAFIGASSVLTLALARIVSGLAVGATTSTATASMASLEPRHDQHHVARVSVAANFGGVATGILFSGFLVEYAPAPTTLVFVVLIVVSLVGALAVVRTAETVLREPKAIRPRVQRLSVPSAIRRPFWAAAGSLAACYSIYGFFAAIGPTFLRIRLDIASTAGSAAVVATMFGLAAISQLGLGQVRDRRALLVGFPIILAATLVLTASVPLSSLGFFAVGDGVLGIGVGFTYMGAVTLVDRVSPAVERGEILSAFFLVGYLALAIPTIGIGVTVDHFGLSVAATSFGVALGLSVAILYLLTWRTPTPPGGGGRPRGST